MQNTPLKKQSYREVLRNKEYTKLMLANIINRFGDSVDSIAFVWLVYTITNSAAWSAIIYGVNKIPTIILQPIAGAIVENRNKKSMMVTMDLIRGICVCIIAMLFAADALHPWALIATTLVMSSAEAFRLPASSSVVLKVLDKESLDFGVSMNASICSVVELAGLGLAGFIIAQFGIIVAIIIDAVTFFVSGIIISRINTQEQILEKRKVGFSSYFQMLKDGARYVKDQRLILNFIILAVVANAMFVPINSLQAPLTTEVLHTGEEMLSVLSIALSISMLLATTMYPYVAKIFKGKFVVFISGVSFGLYYIGLVGIGAFVQDFTMRYILVAVSTFVAGYLVTMLSSYISISFLKTVKPEYIARTAALMNAAGASAIPVVSLVISAGASVITTVNIFIIAGILLILLMTGLALTMRFNVPATDLTQ